MITVLQAQAVVSDPVRPITPRVRRWVGLPPVGPHLDAGEHWGVAEVAAHIGVAESTVTSYVTRGQIPAPIEGFTTPIWRADTIREWHANRPGPGNRGPRRADPSA